MKVLVAESGQAALVIGPGTPMYIHHYKGKTKPYVLYVMSDDGYWGFNDFDTVEEAKEFLRKVVKFIADPNERILQA